MHCQPVFNAGSVLLSSLPSLSLSLPLDFLSFVLAFFRWQHLSSAFSPLSILSLSLSLSLSSFLCLLFTAFSSFFCTVSFHLRRAETPIGYIRSDLLPWWFQPRHEHCRRLTVNDPPRFFSLSFRSALFIPDTRSSFVTDRAGRLFDSTRRKRFRHESEKGKKKIIRDGRAILDGRVNASIRRILLNFY